jgi:hypothetical protein
MASVRSAFIVTTIIAAYAVTSALSASAITYNVSRMWSDGSDTATLTGTVDVAVGSYSIMNQGATPFTNINLLLIVDNASFLLTSADTSLIVGSGEFLISATASTLTFNTANFDPFNPADLIFGPRSGDHYAIGSDGFAGFEAAVSSAGSPLVFLSFPVVFGTAGGNSVTEPGPSIVLLGLSIMAIVAIKTCLSAVLPICR